MQGEGLGRGGSAVLERNLRISRETEAEADSEAAVQRLSALSCLPSDGLVDRSAWAVTSHTTRESRSSRHEERLAPPRACLSPEQRRPARPGPAPLLLPCSGAMPLRVQMRMRMRGAWQA